MIVNERDILASVDHPFIGGLQYAFCDDGEVFMALDLKTGGDLEYYLMHMGRPFTEEETRFMVAEILLGIKVRVARVVYLYETSSTTHTPHSTPCTHTPPRSTCTSTASCTATSSLPTY